MGNASTVDSIFVRCYRAYAVARVILPLPEGRYVLDLLKRLDVLSGVKVSRADDGNESPFWNRMMKSQCLVGSAILVSLIVAGSEAAGRYASVVEHFSNTVNSETSEWSYRSGSELLVQDDSGNFVRDGNYALLPDRGNGDVFSPSTPYWFEEQIYLGVGVNRSGGPINVVQAAAPFLWPADAVWMHPLADRLIVVSWLSPSAGLVRIDFEFENIDDNGPPGFGIEWFVDLGNSSGALAAGVLGNGGASGPISLPGVAVAVGDRINFIVGANGTNFRDSTTLTAEITFLPDPVSAGPLFVALGTVLGGCRCSVRRSNVASLTT